MRSPSQLVEKGKAFSDKRGLRFALRLGVHLRGPFDARDARGVFCDVHAAAKNDLNLFLACGQETLRGFLTV